MLAPYWSANAANNNLDAQVKARQQLDQLTPQEKVGQLFLVTFEGDQTDPGSAIYKLIANYHVGGVVLNRKNDNFQNYEEMSEDCWALVNNLQWVEYNISQSTDSAPFDGESAPAYIPLFIGLSQEGNNSPHSQILHGLSPVPSQLSIGATWDPDLAEKVGYQLGNELTTLGVNLLFGPSLDVISDPKPGEPSDLGVRSFGGDPYWVGKMGQAYIRGLHQGSANQIAVVGKYFPGLGSSDRLPENEIATVRKSLDQLKQIDLAPFFSVTGNSPSEESAVDALLNSHIRYQGLQGNIRSTTRPISLDPQAFELLMSLDPFGTWRSEGGVIISDNLGSRALRQLYDPTGQDYNIRQVALDAFIAGNDILYLGNTGENDQPLSLDQAASILDFFSQKYQEDQTFADRVDQSVLRILALKYSLHEFFNITSVLNTHNLLSELGNGHAAGQVARNSATLISPGPSNLNDVLQNPPQLNERIVILTDVAQEHLCSNCDPITTLGKQDLQESILRLYGPQSGRQVMPANISSFSYQEVITLLDYPSEIEYLQSALSRADWILVVSRNTSTERPSSVALHRLLSERQDLIRGKKLIVFAMNAPYYMDATNISKLTAFFGIYSKLPTFLDVAARLLFREIPSPSGALPVSVPGIGYDLISATSPDPQQNFSLYLDGRPPSTSGSGAPEVTPTIPLYEVGNLVVVETGIILDHNGNPVPDGTPVEFTLQTQGETTRLPSVETKNGMAAVSFVIERPFDILLQALSSPAQSEQLTIRVKSEPADMSAEETSTSPPPTITSSPQFETTPVILPPDTGVDQEQLSQLRVWFLSLLTILAVSLTAYQVGAILGYVRWGIKWGLSALLAGLTVYNYLVLELPGSSHLVGEDQLRLRFGLAIMVSALLGWLVAFLVSNIPLFSNLFGHGGQHTDQEH